MLNPARVGTGAKPICVGGCWSFLATPGIGDYQPVVWDTTPDAIFGGSNS